MLNKLLNLAMNQKSLALPTYTVVLLPLHQRWLQKSRPKATLCHFKVLDTTSTANTISIIIVWLFRTQMSCFFLKQEQAQKALTLWRVQDKGRLWYESPVNFQILPIKMTTLMQYFFMCTLLIFIKLFLYILHAVLAIKVQVYASPIPSH